MNLIAQYSMLPFNASDYVRLNVKPKNKNIFEKIHILQFFFFFTLRTSLLLTIFPGLLNTRGVITNFYFLSQKILYNKKLNR